MKDSNIFFRIIALFVTVAIALSSTFESKAVMVLFIVIAVFLGTVFYITIVRHIHVKEQYLAIFRYFFFPPVIAIAGMMVVFSLVVVIWPDTAISETRPLSYIGAVLGGILGILGARQLNAQAAKNQL